MAQGFYIVEREIFASQAAQILRPMERLMLHEVIRIVKSELRVGKLEHDGAGRIIETEAAIFNFALTPFVDRKTTLNGLKRLEEIGFIRRHYGQNGDAKRVSIRGDFVDYEPTAEDLARLEKQAERVRRATDRGKTSPGRSNGDRGKTSPRDRGITRPDRGKTSPRPGEDIPSLREKRLRKEESDPIRTREAEAAPCSASVTAGEVLASIGIVSAPFSDSSNGKRKPGPRGSLRMRIDTLTGEAAWSPWWREVIKRIDEAGLLGELEHHVSYAEKCADPKQRETKDLGPLKDPGRYLAKRAMEICKPKKILWPAFPEISDEEKREEKRKRSEAKGEFNGAHDVIPF